MKKLLSCLAIGLATCASLSYLAYAAPDPRDSVIIESKSYTMGQDTGAVKVRVFITNRDTLTAFELPLVMRSISGGAYMRLTYPREFGGALRPLDSTLHAFSIVADFLYDGIPPDTFNAVGFRNPADPTTNQLPNLTRKALVELKFDSLYNPGVIELDSAFIWIGASINRVGFVARGRGEIDVNFVKGRITIQPPPCPDMNGDGVLTVSDIVRATNCLVLSDCERTVTTQDIVILIKGVFPPAPLGPPLPCEP